MRWRMNIKDIERKKKNSGMLNIIGAQKQTRCIISHFLKNTCCFSYLPFNLLKTHLAFSSTVFEIVCNHKQS
jgi:hypothetical protein